MAYLEIGGSAHSEIVIMKSKFMCFLSPAETEEAALKHLDNIRASYPDARHHCFAYMVGPERGIMRYSDDGEPQGTAGIPILEVLKQSNLTNVVAVVVRYFGGILLGTGGLTRAYTACTAEAVKNADKVRPAALDQYRIEMTYPVWAKLEPFLRQQGLTLENVEYSENVAAEVLCPKGSDIVVKAAAECSSGAAQCILTGGKVVKLPAEI